MKRKIIAATMATAMLLSMAAPTAYAEEEAKSTETLQQEGLEASGTIEDVELDTHEATSGYCGMPGHETEVMWTAEGDTLTFSGTGDMKGFSGFSPYEDYTHVIIEDGVTNISSCAFFYSKVKTIEIADSVTSIGKEAFSGSELESITLPKNLKSIGTHAFGYTKIKSIVLPEGLESLGDTVFYECPNIESVEIPSSVKTFGSSIFYNSGIKSVVFDKGITSIPTEMFERCKQLENVTIPDGVTTIESGAFKYCDSLKDVQLPDSVTAIEDNAFFWCGVIKDIKLPENLTVLGDGAFTCTGITNFTIPDKIVEIAPSLFESCYSLKDITIHDKVTSIGKSAFLSCVALENISIPDSVTSIGEGAFYRCSGLTELTVPNNVTSIEAYTFGKCTALKTVTIPKNVTNIAKNAFSGCSSLSDVYYNGTKAEWDAITIGAENEYLTKAKIHTTDEPQATTPAATATPVPTAQPTSNPSATPTTTPSAEPTTTPTTSPEPTTPANPDDNNGTGDNNDNNTETPATPDTTGVEGFVDRLYSVCLGRPADAAGKADWVGQLTSYQISGTKAAYGFIFSEEFTNMNYSNADFVEHLYEAFMGRASDEGGKADWVGKLDAGTSREEVFNGFANSVEFDNICKSYGIVSKDIETFVTRLYSVCLDRQPDDAGLADWANQLRSQTISGKAAASGFVFSEEFTNKNYSNADYVEHLYAAFMGRASDEAGKTDWVGKLDAGTSREEVFNGFADSAEFDNICSSYGIVRG